MHLDRINEATAILMRSMFFIINSYKTVLKWIDASEFRIIMVIDNSDSVNSPMTIDIM